MMYNWPSMYHVNYEVNHAKQQLQWDLDDKKGNRFLFYPAHDGQEKQSTSMGKVSYSIANTKRETVCTAR